jgi:translation initiation factor IF-3
MSDPQYSWFTFIGKIIDLIKYFFSTKAQKKEEEQKKSNEIIQTQYNEIDAQKEAKKNEDLEKRINNLF